MAIEHVDIADGERHEPKGASTATIDQVWASDGAGSGAFREIPWSDTVMMADVSTADFVLIPIPINCTIQSIRYVLEKAITVADATITVTRGGGGAAMGTQVIAFSGSAEGTTFDQTPSGNNTITASTHKYIKIATDGASTTACRMWITIKAKVV